MSEKKPNVTAEDLGNTESDLSSQSFVVTMEEEVHDCLPQKKLLLEVKTTLETVKASLHQREKDIDELLHSEQWCGSHIENTALAFESLDK
ncbi:hypothetical protein lerEdw1_000158, partial [Lerista edwardsae]